MDEHVCEVCGEHGTVRFATDGVNRGTGAVHSPVHVLCTSCARERGVPLRADGPRRPPSEPDPPSWELVAEHLRQYERTLQIAPELRELILDMARKLWRYSRQIPGEMPSEVSARFGRFGVGDA